VADAKQAMPADRDLVVAMAALLSAVTLEPAGGVSKPTGAMYLKGAPGLA